ncbi:MAG: dynamin family protein [Oscillospiraceae bacterium]|jgi:predicted GTPase|nr:dynamin family protein [Oscillospiraceae bacterium]
MSKETTASMGKVSIKYNPYTLETTVLFDGTGEPKDGNLSSGHLNGKRIQEWIDHLPKWIHETGNDDVYELEFHGTTLDYEDVRAVAGADTKLFPLPPTHIQGANPEDKILRLNDIFERSKKLGVDTLDGFEEMTRSAFDKDFEAHVIATMSAGKSTLINALLGQKLMPSQNEACTAIVTRIRDTDGAGFTAYTFSGDNDEPHETIKNLSPETMKRLNSDEHITNIVVEGDIPFVDANGMKFVLVDTPGPNNSRDENHRERTMRELDSESQSLIIFVLDATQNGVDSEKFLLDDIAEAMNAKGKMSRDRFLFVVNKVDNYYKDPGRVGPMLQKNVTTLKEYDINDARIYPVSAEVALSSRQGLEPDSIVRATANTMKKIPELHLNVPVDRVNSHISAAERKVLEARLRKAEESGNLDEQALIYSGVPSLEAAIREYMEKYAKAIRISEVAKKLQESFDCTEKYNQLEHDVMTDSETREAVIAATGKIQAEIESGEQGRKYEARLDGKVDDILSKINERINQLETEYATAVREYSNKHRESRLLPGEAQSIAKEWENAFEKTVNNLRWNLSNLLNEGLRGDADTFLADYKKSVEKIISNDEVGALQFDPFVLLGAEMTADNTLRSYTKSETKSERFANGKIKNPERDGFKGFFNIFKPWKIDKIETRFRTEEYVEWKKYADQVINGVRANIEEYCKSAQEQAKANAANTIAAFKAKFKQLNERLIQKMQELDEKSKQDEFLQSKIESNAKLQKDLEKLQEDVASILEI